MRVYGLLCVQIIFFFCNVAVNPGFVGLPNLTGLNEQQMCYLILHVYLKAQRTVCVRLACCTGVLLFCKPFSLCKFLLSFNFSLLYFLTETQLRHLVSLPHMEECRAPGSGVAAVQVTAWDSTAIYQL